MIQPQIPHVGLRSQSGQLDQSGVETLHAQAKNPRNSGRGPRLVKGTSNFACQPIKIDAATIQNSRQVQNRFEFNCGSALLSKRDQLRCDRKAAHTIRFPAIRCIEAEHACVVRRQEGVVHTSGDDDSARRIGESLVASDLQLQSPVESENDLGVRMHVSRILTAIVAHPARGFEINVRVVAHTCWRRVLPLDRPESVGRWITLGRL